MDSFQRTSSVFLTRVDEVTANLRLRQNYLFFVKNQGELFHRVGMRADLKDELGRALNAAKAPEAVLLRGLLLQLYGAFERLITDIAENVLEARSLKAERFSDLPEFLRNSYVVGSAKILAKLNDRQINGVQFDFGALQQEMAACFTDRKGYRLRVESFTAFLGVCNSERVDYIFNALRLGDAFDDELGKSNFIKSWSGKAGAREASKLAREGLDDLVRQRNQIAHGSAELDLVGDNVEDAAKLVAAVGKALISKAQSATS
jgi:hypothetical protein